MAKNKSRKQANDRKKKRISIPGWLLIGSIVLIAVILFFLRQPGNEATVLPAEVSTAEAAKLRENGALILDVREPSEWAQGHIPGATLIPLGDLPNRISELPRNQEIVVVCRSGNRSAQGRDLLLNAGFTQVTSMAGGMNQWISEGYSIKTGE